MDKKNKITADTYEAAAQGYADRFMEMTLYDDLYDRFIAEIGEERPSILEIGCGPANVTRYLVRRMPDADIYAVDRSRAMIDLAKEYVPSARYDVMDCRDISTIEEQYDGVMCGFVMPYLTDEECEQLISDVAGLLREGGVFYFSTMEGSADRSGYEQTSFAGDREVYIHYHREDMLRDAVRDAGMSIIDVRYQDYEEADDSITQDMIFLVDR